MTGTRPDSLPILLEDGSRLDWLEAEYATEVRVRRGQASIRHRLSRAPTLKRMVEDRTAAWAVEVRCPKTLLARVETSSDDHQTVRWSPDDVDGDIFILPGLLAVTDTVLDRSDLSVIWKEAGELRTPCGWWLAKGDTSRANTLMDSLLTFRRDETLKGGRMAIDPDTSGGNLRFIVRVAPDVFDAAKSSRTLQVAALVGVCGMFPRWLDNDEEPLAAELKNRLKAACPDVVLWDDPSDSSYDPAFIATLLEPFHVGLAERDVEHE